MQGNGLQATPSQVVLVDRLSQCTYFIQCARSPGVDPLEPLDARRADLHMLAVLQVAGNTLRAEVRFLFGDLPRTPPNPLW